MNRNQNVVLAKLLHKLNENTRETKKTQKIILFLIVIFGVNDENVIMWGSSLVLW